MNDLPSKIDESMRCILQAIFIMETIGVPEDNMLLKNAYVIKAKILEETAEQIDLSNDIDEIEAQWKFMILKEAHTYHLNRLNSIMLSVGEHSVLAAKAYKSLGTFYLNQDNFLLSEEVNLKAVEISKLILGENHIEVARPLRSLGILFLDYIHNFQRAEECLLQSLQIYKNVNDTPPFHALMCNEFYQYLETVDSLYEDWHYDFYFESIDLDCAKDDLSMEKFKCILNGCSCAQ
ncbi:uncharacterized protein LOC112595114 [Melanaphis sacchari]|uniref:uncharacterized protein LOC112595114 n=1 Tax=Melanaphis sacchari TaxID=742174 RepID=UPI000DC13574|nr:uncharacterized protein LOC112595114 [Melanaphis sacchari]